jgi:hypothetical protein
MGIHRGPNLINESLVFGYDTGYGVADNTTATRFYQGKPISNSINGGADRANVVTSPMHGSHGASVTTEIISYGNRKNVFRIYSTNTSGYYMVNQQSSIINTSGNVYTYSFDYKKIKGTNSSFSPSAFYKNGYKTPDSGSAASNVTDTIVDLEDGWKRLTRTYTSTYTGYNFYRTNLNTDNTLDFEYLFDNFMVNEGVAVPFVDSTRSSTASLIDLTKTNSIDVSNISFDSAGQPEFDGTDDRIVVSGIGVSNYAKPFSMECVFKVPTSGTWANNYYSNIFSIAGSYSGQYGIYKGGTNTIGFQIRDASTGGYAASSGYAKGVYHHVIVTFGGGSGMNLYINGELKNSNSTTFTGAPDSTNLYIGGQRAFGGSTGSWFEGEIPVAKYYDKELTATEIKQNYNVYKNRFNI